MSLSFSLPKLAVPRMTSVKPAWRARFSGAHQAGPRRILAIGGTVAGVGLVLAAATFVRTAPPVVSQPGRLPPADTLPGGPKSTPYQDALALRSNQEAAEREKAAGRSFTPQIAAGQSYAQLAAAQPLLTSPPPKPASAPAAPVPTPAPAPATATPALAVTPAIARADASQARVIQAQAQQGGQGQDAATQGDPRYKAAIDKMLGGWGSRTPRTDVILPPDPAQTRENDTPRDGPGGFGRTMGDGAPTTSTLVAAGTGRLDRQRVLVPAGRGIYAHTILAASSDASGPVVLQADSGPIAGARLIGSFSREDERLVIRGSRIVHGGREINAEWIVVSPTTMEAGVASSVDQHYVSRFVLPAAAAFVQGLGQAVQLSNSAVTASPFGGLTAFQRLNPTQQLGVAAGVAAGRVGQALDQAAPRGPTVKVDVGSSVGVMFLSNVAVPE